MLKVKAVYDNGGETMDRYTIVLFSYSTHTKKFFECLALSADPTHPQGFSQFSDCMDGPHLGKRIEFSDLPDNVRRHAEFRLS